LNQFVPAFGLAVVFSANVRALNPPEIHIAQEVRTALLDFDAVIELEPEKGRPTTHFLLNFKADKRLNNDKNKTSSASIHK